MLSAYSERGTPETLFRQHINAGCLLGKRDSLSTIATAYQCWALTREEESPTREEEFPYSGRETPEACFYFQ